MLKDTDIKVYLLPWASQEIPSRVLYKDTGLNEWKNSLRPVYIAETQYPKEKVLT